MCECVCLHLSQCVTLTPSTARWGSALERYHVGGRTSAVFLRPVGHQNTTDIARHWKHNNQWTAWMLDAVDSPAGVVLQLVSAQLKQVDHGRGEHVVQAVGDDDTIVNCHQHGRHDHGEAQAWEIRVRQRSFEIVLRKMPE